MVSVATVGIDLGKNSCSLAGLDGMGAVVLRRRFTRERLVAFLARQPACVVAKGAWLAARTTSGVSLPHRATRCG